MIDNDNNLMEQNDSLVNFFTETDDYVHDGFSSNINNWSSYSKNDKTSLSIENISVSALPPNINWMQIENFIDRKYGPFGFTFKDKNQSIVVDFQFYIFYLCKGNYNGSGQYLANVTMVPRYIGIVSGYDCTCKVTSLDPTNFGTSDDPNPGIVLQINFLVKSCHDFYMASGFYLQNEASDKETTSSLLTQAPQKFSNLIQNTISVLIRGNGTVGII